MIVDLPTNYEDQKRRLYERVVISPMVTYGHQSPYGQRLLHSVRPAKREGAASFTPSQPLIQQYVTDWRERVRIEHTRLGHLIETTLA